MWRNTIAQRSNNLFGMQMTKLAVVHLSDIHLKGLRDPVLSSIDAIAASCRVFARSADASLLVITGDVAFSGDAAQYALAANKVVQPIVSALEQETNRPVYVAIAPGNHDCVLLPPDPVRETLIEAVVADPAKAEDERMIIACSHVQDAFFSFVKQALVPTPTMHSRLFWHQEFEIGGKSVRVSTLNAAWMSRLPETQGQLVFPIGRFEQELGLDSCLHLALIHHPFNWYAQGPYQHLRKRLRRSCTAILSGHEHQGNVGSIDEQMSGASLYFEASALQPAEGDGEPGFSALLFDLEEKGVQAQSFVLSAVGAIAAGNPVHYKWSEDSLIHGALDVTPGFAARLNDPGGNFTHSAKEVLSLEDLFIWPDVRVWEDDEVSKQRVSSAQTLLGKLESGDQLVIYGDDRSGKTTLLLWLFRELISKGFAPLFLSASELNIKAVGDVEKRIARVIAAQYKNPDAVSKFPKNRRVLLLDDVDRLKSGQNTLPHLLSHAERHFASACLTASSSYEVTNLTSKDAATALAPFKSFDLMRFGLKLRHQLIKKWCALAQVNSKPALDQRIDEVESIVNKVIGKRLVPEHPIYLLILLQSCEQHRHGEIQNSGLSFYYQYLITKSLGEVGVKPIELDEHFNYLSRLAWLFQGKGVKELERIDLELMNRDFSSKFVTVDLSARLELLVKARVLKRSGDAFGFAYPYVHFFFVGRYLSKNLETPEIKAWVEESCKKLYLRDRANAIMFLTHHVENKWVIQLICQVLRECFAEKRPMELDGDTSFLNELAERSSQLTLAAPNVERNQTEIRDRSDALLEQPEDEQADEYELLSLASKWNLLNKTAEILGLILKNYYGSLERDQKQEMIREVFDGPLRALRLWLEEIGQSLGDFISELKLQELADNAGLKPEEAEKRVKRRVFSLMGMVATGVVASAGSFVASDKLREDIGKVVDANPTNAYRLIDAASRLLRPGAVPIDRIKKLASDLEHNSYAFGVLQSLGFYHMYMFHTDEQQKQALSSILKISFLHAKAIEMKKVGRTLGK
jgi:NAD(P)-dependent dehydrogenase (short-subunit alcohol dehydrogenase family)